MTPINDLLQSVRDEFDALSQGQRDAIVIIGVVISIWILQQVIRRVLIRLVRSVASYRHADWDDAVMKMINAPVRLVVIALTLQTFLALEEISKDVQYVANNLALSLLVLAGVVLLYRLVTQGTRTTTLLQNISGVNLPEALLPFVRTLLRLVIIILGTAMILERWGYDVATLAAGLGIGGLAIALAAQETIANLFGFTTIVGDRPFDVGEYIVTSDLEGVVEEVGIRSTRVRRLDQAQITVPNSKLAGSVIMNWSRLQKRRLDFVLGITYDANSAQMRALLERLRKLLHDHPKSETDSVVVFFTDFGDSALDVLVRCYLNIADWAEFHIEKEQINLQIMDIVEELGMSMAFPSRSIYIENLSSTGTGQTVLEQVQQEPVPIIPPHVRPDAPNESSSDDGGNDDGDDGD